MPVSFIVKKDTRALMNLIKRIYKILVTNNLEIIRDEISEIRILCRLIRMHWSERRIYSREEIIEIKGHLMNMAKGMLTVIIVLLPGGFLILPFTGLLFKKKSESNMTSQTG
jgi:hypothetical protein